jgi:glycosyltransferase involved in cell wall biosynthesis
MKVSVFLATYNHEPFIEQAVRSVLMQRVNFDYEVLVGEDASTDGTARVLKRLQAEYPGRVRALLRPRNLGMCRNFIETYQACRGEYIAYLDGDDYWTCPDKLQKQVDYLEEHRDCSTCFHNAHILSDDPGDTQKEFFVNRTGRTVFTVADLILLNNIIPSSSIVVRNGLIDRFPDWLPEVTAVDWVFNILNAGKGKIGYIPEAMAVYRRHDGGVWSAMEDERRREEVLKVYKYLPSVLDPELGTVVEAAAERLTLWVGTEWLRKELERSVQAYESGQACIREVEAAKEWLVGQLGNYQAHVAEQARAYEAALAEEVRNHQAQMEEQEEIHRQQEAEQARRYEARLQDMARDRDAARAVSEALVSRLDMIERSRAWRLVCKVRRLRRLLSRRRL